MTKSPQTIGHGCFIFEFENFFFFKIKKRCCGKSLLGENKQNSLNKCFRVFSKQLKIYVVLSNPKNLII